MKMRQIMSLLLSLALAVGLFAGFGVSAAADEPVTITYCNFNASGGNEETLQKMYEAFHEEYPNITVEIETIGYDDYFTQMQTRLMDKTPNARERPIYGCLRAFFD